VTPEGKIEAYLKRRVEQTHGQIRKLAWLGRRGAPDRMIWWKGPWGPLLAFVEVKAPNGKATTLQKREHARMRAAGFNVYVVASEEAVEAFLTEMLVLSLQ
jgi:hypothetical protein